eukprot:jgi/Botrbrau1/22195/Bobra.168_1s0026.1
MEDDTPDECLPNAGHVATGTGTSQRVPLHALALKDDNNQKLDYVAGGVRNAKKDAPNNKTPSKVLRSGKRIPLSTVKKPKSLSRLQDETLTQVQDNLSSPASAQKEQREDFTGECLKCTGDSIQTPSMLTTTSNAPALDHQHDEGISPDLQIAEQAPSGVFNTSDKVSPIWGVATASLSNFECNAKSSASIATDDLHELLKEIKINKLVGVGNVLPSVGRTPTNTPAGADDSSKRDVEVSPSAELNCGSGELVFAVVKQIDDDSTPEWHGLPQAPANTPATGAKDLASRETAIREDTSLSLLLAQLGSPSDGTEGSGFKETDTTTENLELCVTGRRLRTIEAEKPKSGEEFSPQGSGSPAESAHSGITSFPVPVQVEGSPISSCRTLHAEDSGLSQKLEMILDLHDDTDHATDFPVQVEETGLQVTPEGYVTRGKVTPYMVRHLRSLQANEWSSADGKLQIHKSKLEKARDEAIAAKERRAKNSLSAGDKAAVHRLVTTAVQKAVLSDGKSLSESLVKHKSRLELAKESAKGRTPLNEKKPLKLKRESAGFGGQGLGEAILRHKSQLEKEKEAFAAKKVSRGVPADRPVPGYMKATAASKAGLSDLKVHKSRLEKECELAAQAARDDEKPRKRTFQSAAARAAAQWTGGGLSDLKCHKSKLERDREAWIAKGKAVGPLDTYRRQRSVPEPAGNLTAADAVDGPSLPACTPSKRMTGNTEPLPSYAKPTCSSATKTMGPTAPPTPSGFYYVPN